MKMCDVCNNKLGIIKFKYASGYICKSCYEKASRNFTETIRSMSLEEIIKCCLLYEESSPALEEFEVTSRIGNYMLIDKKNGKFCILDHKSDSDSGEYSLPNCFSVSDVKFCKVSCTPEISLQEIKNKHSDSQSIIRSMAIDIVLYSTTETHRINILSTPVRMKSYAYRRTIGFLQAIVSYFESNGVVCRDT